MDFYYNFADGAAPILSSRETELPTAMVYLLECWDYIEPATSRGNQDVARGLRLCFQAYFQA